MLAAAATVSIAAAGFALARGTRDVGQQSIPSLLTKDAATASRYLGRGDTPPASLLRYDVVLPALRDLATRGRRQRAIAVLDTRERLLVADSCTQPAYTGAVCSHNALALLRPLLANPAARRLLVRAAHGAAITGTAAGRSFAAAPILAGGKRPAGALVAAFAGALPPAPHQSPLGRFWSQWKASLPQDWLWLIALSILLGTTIGALLSQRLARRLTDIATTARQWSHGDLTARADPHRRDELGRLASDLNQMADQLRNLLHARSELAAQQERRRVQRDLHDGIKQELFATSMQLATARASLPAGADTLGAALDQAHAACRRAQHELATLLRQTPSRGDLAAALTELVDRDDRGDGAPVALEIESGPRLPEPVEDALYRVAQEAITNARRHADATTIKLTLARGETTRLRISDDGHGFDPAQPGPGMGLQTMQERIETLGGHLTIHSSPDGTTIEATLPSHEE